MFPRHVAIIMDGNGRWARSRKLPRVAGHRAGMETLRKIVNYAPQKGIEWLTVYAFSSENWARPADEVGSLLSLLKIFIHRDLSNLKKNNVRIRIVGNRTNLSADIVTLIEKAESETKANTGLNLVVAFNYGSRNEIIRAAQHVAQQVAVGNIKSTEIDDNILSQALDTGDIPDPDLVIRTGGEIRLSNFLLWQAAYAEFVFVPDYWPDFSEKNLDEALTIYLKRERRFGRIITNSSDESLNISDDDNDCRGFVSKDSDK